MITSIFLEVIFKKIKELEMANFYHNVDLESLIFLEYALEVMALANLGWAENFIEVFVISRIQNVISR